MKRSPLAMRGLTAAALTLALAAPMTLAPAGAQAASSVQLNLKTPLGHLTGELTFTGAKSFKLTNMKLCDTDADSHQTGWRPITNTDTFYTGHWAQGNGSCVKSNNSHTDYTTVKWLYVYMTACNATDCHGDYSGVKHYNPYA